MKYSYLLPSLVLVIWAGGELRAEEPAQADQRVYETRRVAPGALTLDGKLSEPAWDGVEWSGDFTQHSPANGEAPTRQTEFKVLYDDDALYFAFRAHDDPELVRSIKARRDWFPGDWIEVNISSRYDMRTAFSFTYSCSGVRGDEFISDNGNHWDGNWDPVWQGCTHRCGEGWTAETRIPLSQLRFSSDKEQTWGLQVMRRIFREEERSTWQWIPNGTAGWVSNFGQLKGLEGLKPSRRVELMPYGVASGERFAAIEGDPYLDGADVAGAVGLDGKIGVTNDLTLDFTINPDFGQVEADPSQVNLSAFETFFSERRPFFIEGANIFDFDIAPAITGGGFTRDNLFYSRRIGRRPNAPWYSDAYGAADYIDQPGSTSILGAFKLSGKTDGGLSIGVLESVTARETAELDSDGRKSDVTVEPLTNWFVSRLEKDLREGDTQIGVMLTAVNRVINDEDAHLDWMRSQAYTGGLDFSHIFHDGKFYIMGDAAFSNIRGSSWAIRNAQLSSARYFQRPDNGSADYDPDATKLGGHGGSLMFGRLSHATNFMYQTGGAWRSPGFELNDLGRMRAAAEYNQFAWCGYRWREPFGIFNNLSLNGNEWLNWDWDGKFLSSAFNVNTNGNLRNNSGFYAGISRSMENVSNTQLRGGPASKWPGDWEFNWNGHTDHRKKISLSVGSYHCFGDDEYTRNDNFWLNLNWRPNDAMRISLNPGYNKRDVKMQYVSIHGNEGAAEYIFARIEQETMEVTFRLDYCVTPNLTVQYYGSPFVSAGRYSEFKRISDPMADGFENRFVEFADGQVTREDGLVYFDQDGGGIDYYAYEPDFNYRAFNSNLVLRWEFQPGSLLYAVWSQAREGAVADGRFDFGSDIGELYDIHPHNIFLLKVSKWFSL